MKNNYNTGEKTKKYKPTKGEITSTIRSIDQMTADMNKDYAIVNCGEGECVCTPETCTCPGAKKKTKKVSEEYSKSLH